jgi:Cysteine protease
MKLKNIFLTFIITLFAFNINLDFVSAKWSIQDLEFALSKETVPNPLYKEYMARSDEEKANTDIIPEPYLYIFNQRDIIDEAAYPNKYNLRDYNYVTPVKNQGLAGLCWSYTMTTVIEATAKKSGINISTSPKHFDYLNVTPTNYINEGINPYYEGKLEATESYLSFRTSTRTFMDGGSFINYQTYLASGISPGLTNIFGDLSPTSTSKLSLEKLFTTENANYVVTGAHWYPETYNASDKQAWINMIKNHIVNYGPLYVSTISPDYRGKTCYNSTYNMIDYKYSLCGDVGGHAMTIIGWDDSYGPNNEGAWILQNSWGSTNQFPYLSFNSDINGLYGVNQVELKTWDNNYNHLNASSYELVTTINGNYVGAIQTYKFQKSKDYETLKYLTFTLNSSAQNQQFEVYVSTTGKVNDLKSVGTVTTSYNGIFKLPVNNLLLNKDNFLVGIRGISHSRVSFYTINAFTSNIDETETMTLNTHIEFSSKPRNTSDSVIAMFINFKNNQTISTLGYNVYNSEKQDVTSSFSINQDINGYKNYIINGKSVFRLNYTANSLPADWYTIKINSNGHTSESMIDITFFTSSNPYKSSNGYLYLPEELLRTKLLTDMRYTASTTVTIHENGTNNTITPTTMGTGMIIKLTNGTEKINYNAIIMGDVVGDGNVSSSDALLIRRHAVELSNLDGVFYAAGDVDGDGELTSMDALIIRRYIVGLGEL